MSNKTSNKPRKHSLPKSRQKKSSKNTGTPEIKNSSFKFFGISIVFTKERLLYRIAVIAMALVSINLMILSLKDWTVLAIILDRLSNIRPQNIIEYFKNKI